MASRAQRRQKHRLIPVKDHRVAAPNLRGLTLARGQRTWRCSCADGWMTVSTAERVGEAFAAHVRAANGMEPDLRAPDGDLPKVRV